MSFRSLDGLLCRERRPQRSMPLSGGDDPAGNHESALKSLTSCKTMSFRSLDGLLCRERRPRRSMPLNGGDAPAGDHESALKSLTSCKTMSFRSLDGLLCRERRPRRSMPLSERGRPRGQSRVGSEEPNFLKNDEFQVARRLALYVEHTLLSLVCTSCLRDNSTINAGAAFGGPYSVKN